MLSHKKLNKKDSSDLFKKTSSFYEKSLGIQ